MNRTLFTGTLFSCAFVIGALAILWVAGVFLGADNLGFGVTLLIGLVYAIGTWELLRFRRATGSLNEALNTLSEPLDDIYQWLLSLDSSLQSAVRLRVEGHANGLPAPAVTPYLVGLLVMLGLLGTFVGMVDTLKGAVVALEGTNELEAIRAGLAAPIEGLGIAFGTSVAGVAASAMLGLLSTISRRERLQASRFLDAKIGQELRKFSSSHQQQLAFRAMQDQASTLPLVAEQLGDLLSKFDEVVERLEARLLTNQEQFQGSTTELYRELNESIDHSLKTSLVENAKLISSSVTPLAEKTLDHLSDVAAQTQQQLAALSQQQLAAVDKALSGSNTIMREALDVSLKQQTSSTHELIDSVNRSVSTITQEMQDSSKALLEEFASRGQQWSEQQQEQATLFNVTVDTRLTQLRDDESQRGDAAIERLRELESQVAQHIQSLGQSLEEPMTRLIETASQTPKAAADVIEKLRGEMTKNFERDNDLLAERARLMEQLDSLSNTLEKNSVGQRDAIDTLIERSAETLSTVGQQFGKNVQNESSKLSEVVENFASSSAEMASLGDAFNAAVNVFSESNNLLIENLGRIETSLEKSDSRSNEQLAYYVAQAREIIDHNLLTHKEILDALQMQQQNLSTQKRAG